MTFKEFIYQKFYASTEAEKHSYYQTIVNNIALFAMYNKEYNGKALDAPKKQLRMLNV